MRQRIGQVCESFPVIGWTKLRMTWFARANGSASFVTTE